MRLGDTAYEWMGVLVNLALVKGGSIKMVRLLVRIVNVLAGYQRLVPLPNEVEMVWQGYCSHYRMIHREGSESWRVRLRIDGDSSVPHMEEPTVWLDLGHSSSLMNSKPAVSFQ